MYSNRGCGALERSGRVGDGADGVASFRLLNGFPTVAVRLDSKPRADFKSAARGMGIETSGRRHAHAGVGIAPGMVTWL